MKPIQFKVTETNNSSFHIQENTESDLYNKLHCHPEYQISCIVKGEGISSVGNRVEHFEAGDLYMIGPNVPHVFKKDHARHAHMYSVFFREFSFGSGFFQLPEMTKVREFLLDSSRGLKFHNSFSEKLRPRLMELKRKAGADKIIELLAILNEMALSREWKFLSSVSYTIPQKTEFYNSMNRIFRYISENFDQPIKLEDVANLANLSKYSFCRYFKRTTHKSFVNYLNEFRVGMACKMLHSNNYTISQIGFYSGFNNLSNFNRQFKRIMNCTPSKYRDLYHKYFSR